MNPKIKQIILEIATFAVPALIFLIWKAFAKSPFLGDENIYFYAGYEVTRGVVPFKELAFAHPPLHLLIAALWMLPGSIHPVWLKLASVLPALGTLLCVIWILRRHNINRTATLIIGVMLSCCYELLSLSTHFTGANWSMFLVILGLLFVCQESRFRMILGGVLLCASTLVSFHVIPAACCAAGLAFLWAPRRRWPCVVSFAVFFVCVHLCGCLAFGGPYVDQLFSYHANKTPMADRGMQAIKQFFFGTYPIVALAICSLLALAKDRIQTFFRREAMQMPVLFGIAACAALLQTIANFCIDRVYSYYLAPVLPLSALLAGLTLDRLSGYIKAISNRDVKAVKPLIFSAVIIITGCILGEKIESTMSYYKSKGSVSQYVFTPSPVLPDFLNRFVERKFFRKKRTVGSLDLGITRYLWHENVSESPENLLSAIQPYAHVEGRIFGDCASAPWLALATHRKLALDMPDTNAQLLKSNRVDIYKLIRDLRAADPAFLVVNPNMGIPSSKVFKQYIEDDHFKLIQAVKVGPKATKLYLYGRERDVK